MDQLNAQALQDKIAVKDMQINTLIGVVSKDVLKNVAKSPVLQGVVGAQPATVTAPGPAQIVAAPVAAAPVAPAPVAAAPFAAAPAAAAKVVAVPAAAPAPAKVVPAPAAAPAKVVRTLTKQPSERDLLEKGRHFPGMDYVFQRRALANQRGGRINFDISSLAEVRQARKLSIPKKRELNIMPVRQMSAAEKSTTLPRRARVYPNPTGNLVLLSKYDQRRRLRMTTTKKNNLKPLKRLLKK